MADSGKFTRGHPKRGGRKRGVPNKVGADVRELASTHTPEAIDTLVGIMGDTAAPHAARVMAANSLLDRACGKPGQAVAGPGGGPVPVVLYKDDEGL